MLLSYIVASRSTCDRAYVGCVLTRDNRLLSSGYNGSAPGLPHCEDEGHLLQDGHCIRTIHAEQNAVSQCAKDGIETKGATAYVTHFPCINCSKTLISAGISTLYYLYDYRVNEVALKMLEDSGMKVINLDNIDPSESFNNQVVNRGR